MKVVTLSNGYRTMSTFISDFEIAEKFGFGAIQDTWNRAFEEWKEDIDYIIELFIAMNFLGLSHYNNMIALDSCDAKRESERKMSEWYFDRYYDVRDFVYGEDSGFSSEERRKFFEITD